ncbi:MAG: hypothetical protein MPJ78_19010 [Hyphomicrobiaceae bacterium]|nr:hypothetical protein [Hyphomicrobiaceae bacterium]
MKKPTKPPESPVVECSGDCSPGTASPFMTVWRMALLGLVVVSALILGRAALASPEPQAVLSFPNTIDGVLTVPDHIAAHDQQIAEACLNSGVASLFSVECFDEMLLICPQTRPGFITISQEQCLWLRYDEHLSDCDCAFEDFSFDESACAFSGGGQTSLAPHWGVGIARVCEGAGIDINAGQYDVKQPVNFGGFNRTARSSFDVDHMRATFHAAYPMGRTSSSAKLFVDENVTHIDREAAQESDAGAANLDAAGDDEIYLAVNPAPELGISIERGDGRAIRSYVLAGVTLYADQLLPAHFDGARGSGWVIHAVSEFDDTYAEQGGGVILLHGDAATVSNVCEGHFSFDARTEAFSAREARGF